ncbi:hypothetical protein J4462_04015 [Candidatus Pacearchaeota archaeon]|nr:hypothetical protein [Candidatus Pacearchaeota archaeon]
MVVLRCGDYSTKEENGELIDKECHIYMDGILHENLEEIKRIVMKKDFDYVAVISGRVGKGKSVFGQQLAKYFDTSFDISRVCFSAREFIEVTTSCPKHSAVILDEAFESLNTKISMSPEFLKIQNHLSIIRQRNLFIFLILPSFFDLHKSLALNRTQHLFHIYGKGFGDRGRFAAFSPDNKRILYIRGSKYHDYNAWRPNIRGRFTAKYVLDRAEYEKKKLNHLLSQSAKLETLNVRDIQKIKLVGHLKINEGWKIKKLSEIMGISKQGVYDMVKKYEDGGLNVQESS